MKVIIREAAYDDLDRIYTWIAKDRPRSADSVIDRIFESAERVPPEATVGIGGDLAIPGRGADSRPTSRE